MARTSLPCYWSGPLAALAMALLPLICQGSDTQRLQTPTAEAIIATEPALRVLGLAETGHESLLTPSGSSLIPNIRLAAIIERDGQQVVIPFDKPARGKDIHADRISVETFAEDGPTRLRLEVTFHLSSEKTQLSMDATLHFEGGSPGRAALWALASLPPRGWIVTPLSHGFENNRWVHGRVVAFWNSPLDSPCLRFDGRVLGFDLSKWPQDSDIKYGTRSHAGWIAALDPARQSLLVAASPYESSASYPDEDSNMTVWLGADPLGHKYAEMEWLSPWGDLSPATSIRWTSTLESRRIPPTPVSTAAQAKNLVLDQKSIPGEDVPAPSTWRISGRSPMLVDSFGHTSAWYLSGPDQPLAATASFWRNSPRLSPSDQSLLWTPDTFIEIPPASVPRWSEEDRSWTLELLANPEKDPLLLLQDGDASVGLCILLANDSIHAVLWNKTSDEVRTAQLSHATALDQRSRVQVTYSHRDAKLTLKVNNDPPQSTNVPFSVTPAKPQLVIGRSHELPTIPQFFRVANFTGRLFSASVANITPTP